MTGGVVFLTVVGCALLYAGADLVRIFFYPRNKQAFGPATYRLGALVFFLLGAGILLMLVREALQ
ncbi:MAG TPA: hypothetical protein VHC68_02015 [Candidatus Paceibacterota bacterium]|nr:hypothetical protein [Candidatus Paceibacterota bacterium]